MKCPHCDKQLTQVGDLWVCPNHKIVEPKKHDEEAATAEKRPRLFLSYGRRDARDLADRLSVDLTAAGYEVWQDTSEIRAGHSWENQIQGGLRSTQIVIALLSPHAVRKSTDPDNPDNLDSVCLDEISFARFAQPAIPILPVMARQCEPPFCIFRLDYVDLTSWSDSDDQYRDGLQRLLDGIEAARRHEIRYRTWMHRLKPLDEFDAYLNEKRQDFCGRQWLFDQIDAWRLSGRERALLITGDPGTGKSAIVAQLVHLNPGAQLLAYHCCMADTPKTLRPARFVQSLAAMIGSRLPAYAEMLETAELQEQLSDANCNEDPASALESGILARLEELAAPDEGVRYIMIDALDEALTLHEGDKTIVDLLASRIDRLPSWLRIVATTRNDPEVLRRLSGLRAETIDASDPRNLEDIDDYIAQQLQTPNLAERLVAAHVSLKEVQEQLREAGDGNFLYVKQALIGIERDNYQLDRLEDLPQGLTGLYGEFFQRQFGKDPNAETYGPTRRVLEVAVAAGQPLLESQIALATNLDPEYELPTVLNHLATFLPQRDGYRSLYHKSLADWLTQTDNPYRASANRGHAQLSDMCWRQFQNNVDVMSRYALAFLPRHLIAAKRWDDIETVLTDLRYIQAVCEGGMTFDLVRDFHDALAALPELQPQREQEQSRQEQLQQYGMDLVAYAKGEGPLPTPPDTRATQESMRRAEAAFGAAESANVVASRASHLRMFSNFVSSYSHQLDRFPDQTIQIAFNHASGGPVTAEAEALAGSLQNPWLRREPRPPAPPEKPLCLRTLEGHSDLVRAVALTPDGHTAVSGSNDKTLRVWDLNTGECLRTLEGHSDFVRAVALTSDGNTAVSGSKDRTLRVWDLASGECLWTMEGHFDCVNAVALTPDGNTAVSGSEDRTLRVWNLASGECLRTIEGHSSYVYAVALAPDGNTAVSGSNDKTLRVWELDSGECLRTLVGHQENDVHTVALSLDGTTAISGSWDNTLRVWALDSGECLRTMEGHSDFVNAVALTPDGNTAVSGSKDKTLRIWNMASGECLRTMEGHSSWVDTVALTPDGNTVISGSWDKTLRVWHSASGECHRTLEDHSGSVSTMALTRDGNTAVSGGTDAALRVWNQASGECLRTMEGHAGSVTTVALTPDGNTAVSGSNDNTLRVWDLGSGECLRTLEGHTDFVNALALTSDGNTAVSGSSDNTLRIWGLASGECLRTLEGHTDWVEAVALTPDGNTAVSASMDNTLRVWDLASGECLRTLEGHSSQVRIMALTPNGNTVVSGSWDETLRVWDLDSGECLRTLEGHSDWVNSVALTPDGNTAVSGGRDNTLRVWDLASGECLRTLEGGYVMLTPDGNTAVSGGSDNTLRVWDLAGGEQVAVYPLESRCSSVATSVDNRIIAGTSSGQMHFLTLQNWPH